MVLPAPFLFSRRSSTNVVADRARAAQTEGLHLRRDRRFGIGLNVNAQLAYIEEGKLARIGANQALVREP